MRLATLLERVNNKNFKVNFKKFILFKNGCFKAEKLVKNLIPPTACELSCSIGTFSNNYDVTNRKPNNLKQSPQYVKDAKGITNTIVETTRYEISLTNFSSS